MVHLEFDPTHYSVTYQCHTITLLAKEFALLRFLYEHQDRAFTRDELLDRVWSMETPVDRTVDDHIYRLRKKLKRWQDTITLHTVRGYGYSLTVQSPQHQNAMPSLHDAELVQHMHNLIWKFNRLGQGKSIITLVQQQEALGITMQPYDQLHARFVQADIGWILGAEDIPFRERLYYLLSIYFHLHDEPEKTLAYAEQVLAAKVLLDSPHRELYILNILDLYTEAGYIQQALERLQVTHQMVAELKLKWFKCPVMIVDAYVHTVAGLTEQAEEKLKSAESLIQQAPYLREIAMFRIVKGLWTLQQGDRVAAEAFLNAGFEVLQQTHHVPMIVRAVHQVRFFLREVAEDASLLRKYQRIWEEVEKQYRLNHWRQEIEKKIDAYLGAI